jgi:hypothetical protein
MTQRQGDAFEGINLSGGSQGYLTRFHGLIAKFDQATPDGVSARFKRTTRVGSQTCAGDQGAQVVWLKDNCLFERENCLQESEAAGQAGLGHACFDSVGPHGSIIDMVSEDPVDQPETKKLHQKDRPNRAHGHGRKQDVDLEIARRKQAGDCSREEAQAQYQKRAASTGATYEKSGARADGDDEEQPKPGLWSLERGLAGSHVDHKT